MASAITTQLSEYFADVFYRGMTEEAFRFRSISMARGAAASRLGLPPIQPGTAESKQIDEAIEGGLIRASKRLLDEAVSPQEAYSQLVTLYQQQPNLNVRSSTSVAQQAYSTPVPVGYLAATLARLDGQSSVYEPTAGHGSLLLLADSAKATVNELNPERAADLRSQGYIVTEHDAATYQPATMHDVVIANPPFGTVRNDANEKERFTVSLLGRPFHTTQIDQAIALQSLTAMRDDGRAVLILGGKLGVDEAKRSDRYNTAESRGFYHTLYRHYGVSDHFTIWGDLYRKQGAGFPIDVIVIEGRGASSRQLPAADVPRIYTSFEELGELLNDVLQESQRLGSTDSAGLIGSITASERDRDFQRAALPRAPQPAGGLVNPMLDGATGRLDAGRGKNIGPRRDNSSPGAVYPSNDRRGRQSDDVGGVATSVGAGDSTGQRQYSGTVGLNRNRLSSNMRDRPDAETRAASAVSVISQSDTDSRGMAAQLNFFDDGISWAAETISDGDAENEQFEDRPIKQVPYTPHSLGKSVDTQVPVNMQLAVGRALDRLEERVGLVDAYVADRLQYGSSETLYEYFSAEQVDALALAIENFEQGNGFIIGDQTGIGKGRVVAGLMRFAKVTNRTPMFVTKDPALYADMIRDLSDIGIQGFNPFVTNRSLPALPLPDGRVLKTGGASHDKAMAEMQESGDLGRYDGIFTTYSQMQTVRGRETPRRDFLRAFARNSIVVLDESHEAGGDSNQRTKANAAANRADFTRELLSLADGALYSSATYAKRPDVMDLYFRTDMHKAVRNMGTLAEIVEGGGVPMQQALATMLSDAGQYIRRERSFEGVKFSSETSPVNHETAEKMSVIMGRILNFDTFKQQAVKDIDKDLKAEAKAIVGDSSIGIAGASSTNFTSVMHNLVDQMLLALKAEATVQKSLELLQQPQSEKPVIALASTMGSFIGQYAEMQDIHPGEALEADFGDLLERYLERSRDVIVGNPYGEKERRRLTDRELGSAAVTEYQAILRAIQETDLSAIPISPIDYITGRLEQERYRVREITGREHTVSYADDGQALYERRSGKDRSKATAIKNVTAFNSGDVDVLLLNRSGSTGISLHASDKFIDQRRRHMIVVQPERDINLFMQTLGRVHRTGQVVTPNFTLLSADIPAEKRPAAVLSKKMASLNANTTAARSSGIDMDDVPDFMNEYGDTVVSELMEAYPSIHKRLGTPLKGTQSSLESSNAVRKVTGRIPLLPLAEQESLYQLIESEYQELVQRQEAMGESILEAQHLPLDAKPLARMEVEPADAGSTSPFTGPVYLNLVDAKNLRKPYRTLDVINRVREELSLSPVKELSEHNFADAARASDATSTTLIASTMEAVEQYRHHLAAQGKKNVIERQEANLAIQVPNLQRALKQMTVGTAVTVIGDSLDTKVAGVVGRIYRKGDKEQVNPAAPSMWKVQIIVADGMREITLPLSKINTGGENGLIVSTLPQADQQQTYDRFDELRAHSREQRQIFTGNLLRAYEKFPHAKVVNFTDFQGQVHTGLLMKKEFDIEKQLEEMPVQLTTVGAAKQVLVSNMANSRLETMDRSLSIQANKDSGHYVLTTPKSKASGGKYFLNKALLEATGADFYSVSDRMECSVAPDRLDDVLVSIVEINQWSLAAYEDQALIRQNFGFAVPSFETVAILPDTIAAKISDVEKREEKSPENLQSQENDRSPISSAIEPVPVTPSKIASEPLPKISSAPMLNHEHESLAVNEQFPTHDRLEPQERASARAPQGAAEKNVVKLLSKAGLTDAVMAERDFHLKIDNDPFIPLVIERQGNELILTHYLEQNGDTFIDTEMTFTIGDRGQLALKDTAVQGVGREYRAYDRGFAKVFSRNLLEQGFAEAAQPIKTSERIQPSSLPQLTPNTNKEALPSADDVSSRLAATWQLSATTAVESQNMQGRLLQNVSAEGQQPESERRTSASRQPQGIATVSPLQIVQQTIDNIDPQTGDLIAAESGPKTVKNVSLDELRDWYRAARDMNFGADRLDGIALIGKAAKTDLEAGHHRLAIASEEHNDMQRTLQDYTAYLKRGEQVKTAASNILARVGEKDKNGHLSFKGKLYQLTQTSNELTITSNEGGTPKTILHMVEGQMKRSSVLAIDCERFAYFLGKLQQTRQAQSCLG